MCREKVLEGIGLLGSFASFVSLLFIEAEWKWPRIVLLILLIGLCLVSSFGIFFPEDRKTCKSKQEIKKFMKKWIETDGVVQVLSRDLSWVDDEMACVLAGKGKDLHLYVYEDSNVTEKIKIINPACNIYFYSKLGFTPMSRFTIIRANKPDRQMAIAIKEETGYKKFRHCIHISKATEMDNKMLMLADDLLNVLKLTTK